jgi:hypothetical protein
MTAAAPSPRPVGLFGVFRADNIQNGCIVPAFR